MKKNVAVNRICAVCLLVMAALLCGGCYTQLATYEPSTGGAGYSTDEDIKRKARQRDTIHIREREHCVWTRNFWGEPVLRCYDSRYSWQWRDYNYEPWWYRNSPYYDRYHDPRCPMYYYYDPACGCCRYYEERPSSGGGSGGGGSGGGAAPPPKSGRKDRSYGFPSGGSGTSHTTTPQGPQKSVGDGIDDRTQEDEKRERESRDNKKPRRRAPTFGLSGDRTDDTTSGAEDTKDNDDAKSKHDTPSLKKDTQQDADSNNDDTPKDGQDTSTQDEDTSSQSSGSDTDERKKEKQKPRRRNPRSW